MASLADMNRGELEDLAASLGIEDPEGFPNMGSLRDAISQKQQQEEPVAEDDAPTQVTESAASGDGGASQVQEMMDKEQEQGFVGRKVDPLDGLCRKQRRGGHLACTGAQSKGEPFEIRRVVIGSCQCKGVGPEWLFRILNAGGCSESLVAVDESDELAICSGDHEG